MKSQLEDERKVSLELRTGTISRTFLRLSPILKWIELSPKRITEQKHACIHSHDGYHNYRTSLHLHSSTYPTSTGSRDHSDFTRDGTVQGRTSVAVPDLTSAVRTSTCFYQTNAGYGADISTKGTGAALSRCCVHCNAHSHLLQLVTDLFLRHKCLRARNYGNIPRRTRQL
jgi:hypothetical protein